MFRSAIVQYLNDYSDKEMEEAARYNLIIKWLIGIPVEDKLVSLVDEKTENSSKPPKNAEKKRFHGMAKARYWGLPKVNVQFII